MTDVVDIRARLPNMRLKTLEWSDKRARCQHPQIEVWAKEPIIECKDCGAVIDPYAWMRGVIGRWDAMEAARKIKLAAIDAEIEDHKKVLRLLRKEYADEAEKRAAERAIAILPPRRLA